MKLNQDKETLDQIAPLVEYAFLKNNDIREDPNFLSRYNHSMSFGEYKDGHLASYIMVNKFKSMIFAKKELAMLLLILKIVVKAILTV